MAVKKFATTRLCPIVSSILQVQKNVDKDAVLKHLNGYLSGKIDGRECLRFFEGQYKVARKTANADSAMLWDELCSALEADIQRNNARREG